MNKSRDDIERVRALYEGKGEGREPFWSFDNWGQLIPEIQYGEGQFRDLVIEALRGHGLKTGDMSNRNLAPVTRLTASAMSAAT